MQQPKYVFLSSILLFGMYSCTSSSNEVDTENAPVQSEQISAYSNSLINEILGGEGTFRGFDLGQSLEEIKQIETLEQFQESEEELGYTFETENSEVVDIYYSGENDELNTILVDIYLNSDSLSKEVAAGVRNYFTMKYGQAVKDSIETWNVNDDDKVSLKLIDKKLDSGLQILYSRRF